jgi:hypothetical protein
MLRFGEELYSFSVKGAEHQKALAESISRYGLLRPLVVLPEGEGFITASGSSRLRALKEAGIEEASCIVFAGEETALFDLLLEEALASGGLNPAETCLYLKKRMERTGEDAKALARNGVLEKLGLPARPGAVEDPLFVAGLPREELLRFASGEIPFRGVRILACAPRADALAVLELTRGLRIGQNKFHDLARQLLECAWREGITVSEWAKREKLYGFPGEGDLLREKVFSLRYPTVAGWTESFDDDAKLAALPGNVRLEHSKGFEGGRLRLVISFSGLEELSKAAKEVEKKISAGDLDPLLKYLK